MSITDIILAARSLSRGEKVQLAQILLEELTGDQQEPVFKEGQVYPIYTPEFSPGAATELARLLAEEQTQP